MTPDWMPGVVPRCVPVETKNNQHGERATTIVVGTERVKTRGKWRTVEVLACPVTWRPHPEQIASARRGYEDWWQALDGCRASSHVASLWKPRTTSMVSGRQRSSSAPSG